MNIRRIKFLHWLARWLTLVACFFMSDAVSLAQIDAKDAMQIDPPPVPRYRKPRPAFEAKADPTAKPLPMPTMIAEPPPTVPSEAKPWTPTPAQLAAKNARIKQYQLKDKQNQLKDTNDQIQKDEYFAIAKVVGTVLVVGIGIFSINDIIRQFRKAKQIAAAQEDDEENDWEP